MDVLVFYVNGKRVEERCPDPEMTLLYYLRNKLKLPGTKLGCGEGGCGACTVMISKYNRETKIIRWRGVTRSGVTRSSLHGSLATSPLLSPYRTIITISQGLPQSLPQPVETPLNKERISSSYGSQCGFCTPGIVMSMYTLLRNNPTPTRAEMESAFEGNLCRCTGYRPIIDGFSTFTKEFQCGMGKQCCKNNSNKDSCDESNGKLFDPSKFSPYDPTQEPIFPSELQVNDSYDNATLTFSSERVTWHRPVSLQELVSLKAQYPGAKIIIGNTEIGVEIKFKNMHYPVMIAATHIPELYTVRHTDEGIEFGASSSLSSLEHHLRAAISEYPAYKTGTFDAIIEMLRWFAGHQIRNVAAIAGNIMTASPISDLNPLFMAAGCMLSVQSKDAGEKKVKMDQNFFLGYRRTALKPEDVLVSILIPFTKQREYFAGYKQAQRREDDIAIVNGGMRVQLKVDNTIEDLALSFGGMAPVTVMALGAMDKLKGRQWNQQMMEDACGLLAEDLPMPPGTPGGTETYRRTLTTSFFYKFYLSVLEELKNETKVEVGVNEREISATYKYSRPASKGVQVKEEPGHERSVEDPVGRSKSHLASRQQATGEAQYTDDIPKREDELYLGLVYSKHAHARLVKVDPTPALSMPGVKAFFNKDDVPGQLYIGVGSDEPVFADDVVQFEGQVIGAIVAENQMQAQRAAKAVVVEYEQLKPIITIEDALESNSFHEGAQGLDLILQDGDVEAGFKMSDHVVEGEIRIGGQEHFYLETNATLAIPRGEDDELEIFSSCQAPTHGQMDVSKCLGIPMNRITFRAKRLGGGFGGKETQFMTPLVQTSIAAAKLNKPVRCMLDRDEDMVITGTRHPMLCRYKVGYNKNGKLISVKMDIFSNAGYSMDLSYAVLMRCVFHADNAYKVPNIYIRGRLCKTNLSSNTAFRGFGGPQGMFFMESILSNIALALDMKQEVVRAVNLLREGDSTHFHMLVDTDNIHKCWTELQANVDVPQLRKEICEYNNKNRWKKRGLAVVPTKFGLCFNAYHLNQAGCLVHIYIDGSVFVSHGGVEMGQGLHTKMQQVTSRALGVPMDKIHIVETNTNTVPNTSASAASMSSDLNGMAIVNACEKLKKTLEPFREKHPDVTWEKLVNTVYMSKVSLSATGFYGLKECDYDFATNSGQAYNYFTIGAAVSMVEIDCLTGDHTVLRTDIVMDVGQSLNPAIDIGQIEGAFMQGYGLMTLEFQRYSPKGILYSRGPGAYKIPGFGDIPLEFNVSLLKGSYNKRAVYSSKGIGEPPLFLASSVFFAIKEAIAAARQESGIRGPFRLDSPATAWKIRMACEDEFTQQFPEADPSTYTPWFVYP